MALYLDKISENEQKIKKLEESIKRDTAKKKKLVEENARLTYLSLCEQYNSSGRDLLDILANEHEQAISLKTNNMPYAENSSADDVGTYVSEDTKNGETENFSDDISDIPEQDLFFGDKSDFYKN
ncbi:MAG: hypothetical protein K2K89_11540 [Ruminococcus sp.]|nr:hypothetical protein [Ruminococcus sp.]